MVTLDEVLDGVLERAGAQVRTVVPGVVVSYDTTTQSAAVQPTIREGFDDAEEERVAWVLPPIVPNAPVCFFAAGGWTMHAPLAPGDPVLLLLPHTSLTEWLDSGSFDNIPNDIRRFDWTDALVLPMPARPEPLTDLHSEDMVLSGHGAEIRMSRDGRMSLSAGGEELSSLLEALVSICETAMTGMGVPAFSNKLLDLANLKSKIQGWRV